MDEGPRLSAEAWEALFRAQVSLMRRFEAAGDFAPLRAREYDVLFTLARAGGRMRQRDLNESILLSQPSLSRLVDRLGERGLIVREPAPGDGRGVLVALTEAGADLQRAIGRRHVRTIHRLVGGALDPAELRTLTRLAERLRTGGEQP